MGVKIHFHAKERMEERGATEKEVMKTVKEGEQFPVKFGRVGYRYNFKFDAIWKNKKYNTKQIEAYTVKENSDIIVITVLVKYF